MTDDWDFELGEPVVVGIVKAIVTGQATYAYEPDGYQVLFTNDAGLPEKQWFSGDMISKGKTQ